MPSQPPIPHLLTPYVTPPRSSLSLVTSVLSATGNWLVLRILFAALGTGRNGATPGIGLQSGDGVGEFGGSRKKVVLLSFLRGWDFWKSEAKRLGLDIGRLSEQGRFAFIDGLSELFHSSTPTPAVAPSPFTAQPAAVSPRGTLPVRSAPGTLRTPAQPAAAVPAVGKAPSGSEPVKRLHLSGRGQAALDTLEKDIVAVINGLKGQKGPGNDDESEILLIIDQPDLLLAATGLSHGISATDMGEWIMGLQQHVYSTVVTLAADSPLIHNASAFAQQQQATPLETEHAAFVVGLAHRASMVMQLRNLDTGAAKDVSGVLRISKGGGPDQETGEGAWEEKEVLYFVQRDGGVRVFGRGE
ncbi:hypothetical protein DTO021C3_8473 [Paecilomyces variotii]|nr:hypothetical protein DTO021C3_8473 [Paecilomyces variotii]KAJ9356442.1 hypothetical protein DTO027B9_3654 [Paecilomyces variotii]KAJ9369204.1 hypothetical protein DTO282E5_6139 [Paecilomyces variotii]KAJ9390867.1 hypothetical protein DTO063F5_1311 [Paecilomyces variotii]KAJ9402201.1 hypothetical protein DTO282F9_965 [Paecilomyces variotii]